jgi:hypothetical protein
VNASNTSAHERSDAPAKNRPRQVPDLYQVIVECRDEAEQRELFERMRHENRKVKLLVL